MSIQRWMILALTCGLSCLCFSTVFTTQAATALNWVIVARMVWSLSPKAVNNVSTRRSRVPARILRILQVSSWLTVWPGGRRSPSA
ncbi:hypothetical protein GOODEAATRI_009569, partial [Goodea atripinnis]